MEKDQLLRIGQVAAGYYSQIETKPEPHHFDDWINSLQEPLRSVYRKNGFEAGRGTLNFRRFVAELNDEGMAEYMLRHLAEEDYRAWQRQAR